MITLPSGIVLASLVIASALALQLPQGHLPQGHLPQGHLPAYAQAPSIRSGDSGQDVLTLQHRLRQLSYDPGETSGHFGKETRYAVWAFQKANRLKPTGVVGRSTWRALESPRLPRPLTESPGDRVEVNIRRQLLVAYENKRVVLITHISSGTGGTATPEGDFRVIRRIRGWHRSRLGWMYRPLYFHGGFAMHGSTRVPLRPASHGCVRVPMHTADRLARLVPNDTRVYIG